MRAPVLLSALCAIGAMSSPLQKRAYETDLTIVTVTRTITAGSPPPTVESTPFDFEEKKEGHHRAETATVTSYYIVPATSSSAEAADVEAVTASSSAAPEPTTTTSAVSEAPATTSSSSSVTTSAPATTSTTASSTSTSSSAAASTSSSVITSAAATTSTIASSTSTSSSAAASTSSSSTYQALILEHHNIHRSNHSASDLSWSTDLESSAKDLADSCVYAHNTTYGGGGYGQNIGYGISASNIGKMITNLMYNDEVEYFSDLYGEADPDMTYFENWGHFSQIVWKNTTEVGCYTTVCSTLENVSGETDVPFTVCNYSPAGNYEGEYGDNVGKPLGDAMVVVS